jgi:hypothetical protein
MWPTVVALIVLLGLIYLIRTRQSGDMVIPRLVGTGQYAVEVVGNCDYLDGLEAICGRKTEDGVNMLLRARLTLLNEERFERQAIRVSIRGRTVGYLPQTNAGDFRRAAMYVGLGRTSIFECAALIRGGRSNKHSTDGDYSVWLDLPNDGVV